MELCKNTNTCSQRRDLHPASSFCFWLAGSAGWLAGWLLGLAGRQPADLAGWKASLCFAMLCYAACVRVCVGACFCFPPLPVTGAPKGVACHR